MLTALTGFFSGIISGMGIGGGAVLIPALIILEGISQKLAQGINLTYFIPTAVISLIVHFFHKRILVKTALIIGICGAAGAALGAALALRAGNELLRRMFGFFLAAIGIYEVYKGVKMEK